MDKLLLEAARAGHLILTVNDRLSRHLCDQYDLAQRHAGLKAWLRPELLSLSAWLQRCQGLLPGSPRFLSPPQLQHVWEMLVEADIARSGNPLLQVPQTARRALQAHQLLVRYDARFGTEEAAEDHRAFLRWRNGWQREAADKGWHDPVETPWLLAEAIEGGVVPLPETVVFAGFDDLTPDVLRLIEIMEHGGVTIHQWQPQPFANVQRMRLAATDIADEVRTCARWVRHLLSNRPGARIGVVAPQLETYGPLVEQTFLAELEPDIFLAGDQVPRLFNMSLGYGLDREGVVAAALRLLRMALQLDQHEVSWLLRTPYLGKAFTECAARAQIDRELRRMRRFDWSLPRLVKAVRDLSAKHGAVAADFSGSMTAAATELSRSARHLPGLWAEHFVAYLHKLGWPGERGLSSREYQAVQQFRKTLGELASLDDFSGPLGRSAAAGLLSRLCSASKFQPEGSDAPVQVLGELESSGMCFDHLWVLGLHDAALPSSPSPNPFIPLPVQRRHRMRRCDAVREQHFAEQVAARLFSCAPQVVASWPSREQNAEMRPSPYLSAIADGVPPLADSAAPDRVVWLARPELEALVDSQGPPVSSRRSFTGGTGIIKDQALCPFRAFAHHRLRAERLDVPDVGIDSMSRGTLVHTVLELFWAQVVDQSALEAMDEEKLRICLDDAVARALDRLERERRCDLPARQRQVEQRRLFSLARQWLEIERRRGRFRVTASEQSRQVTVGALTIRTRIDRIDQLEDGTCAIIDYKTGRPDPLQWLEERITEPQLPIYCLALPPGSIGAAMFAVVRSKEAESGFSGLARDLSGWPGATSRPLEARLAEKGWESFDEVLAHWQASLPALGDAFAAGVAAVDPVDPVLACQYCDLTGLCRILEQETLLREAADD